ncbi:MAG TPA: DNA polymerase III subunit delta [Lachnospiraceae bacterium]|nr:DNA polymerase III subunit delta [Lachnospiraceae bacterium]
MTVNMPADGTGALSGAEWGLIGQDNIKERLQSAIINGTVGHAYIIDGEEGSGKRTLAGMFSMALQCESLKRDEGLKRCYPCMRCSSCGRALSGNHPDIIRLTHEKPDSISVDEVREQVVRDASIKPYSSSYKVYLIAEAEKMTVQAQNALLKTLEEPPSYAVIILVTNNISALLPTIISRCAVFRTCPLDNDAVRDYLMKELHADGYQAGIYTALARGNIGRAKALTGNEELTLVTNEAVRLFRGAGEYGMGRLLETVRLLKDNRSLTGDFFDVIQILLRDVLMYKAEGLEDRVIFKEELGNIKEKAASISFESLNNAVNAIDEARKKLKANVNFEITMELFLLSIRDSLRAVRDNDTAGQR